MGGNLFTWSVNDADRRNCATRRGPFQRKARRCATMPTLWHAKRKPPSRWRGASSGP